MVDSFDEIDDSFGDQQHLPESSEVTGGSRRLDTIQAMQLETPLYVLTKECVMASNTKATEVKRKNRKQSAGRKRKNREARNSTPTLLALFAGLGEPGKPAPRATK
jgi:hypothetical protein